MKNRKKDSSLNFYDSHSFLQDLTESRTNEVTKQTSNKKQIQTPLFPHFYTYDKKCLLFLAVLLQ